MERFPSLVALGLLLTLATTGCPAPVELTVTTTADLADADPGDGVCAAATGACSLRAAIEETNALPAAQSNVLIDFAVAGTFDFVPDDTQGFVIQPGRRVVLDGFSSDPTLVTIEPDIGSTGFSRIFTVLGGAFELNHVRLRGGRLQGPPASSENRGGAIRVSGGAYYLALDDCIVEDNDGGHRGGAIYAEDEPFARVSINESIIRDNLASNAGIGGAGGVQSYAATDVRRSLFERNRGNGGGLRIEASGAPHFIEGSTFHANESSNIGGGLRIDIGPADSVRITNSTFSGNVAGSTGGGVWVQSGDVTFAHVTITDNRGSSPGRGLYIASSGSVEVAATLIAQNPAFPVWSDGDVACGAGATLSSGGFNVLNGVTAACGLAFDLTNQIGTEDDPIDARIAGYSDDPIGHHRLLSASPAIDTAEIFCTGVDQIDQPRPVDGDGDGSARCDVGSIENVLR